jgi:adenosylmethionine-8-amino-7-oxononanoate aminotransferase
MVMPISGPYTYRNPFDESDAAKLAQFCLQALDDEIAFQGAATIAAFIMEPILGARGVIPPHPSFMPGFSEICCRNGILLIADEVITAFGRTGAWTDCRLWGVKPDFSCTAKAIINAYFPFGAVMIAEGVADVFVSDVTGKAVIGHGYTYSGHPVGAAAALATLAETKRLNVKDNADARGLELFQGAQALMAKYECIRDVRGGYGLMTAIEMISDRKTKAPPAKADPSRVQAAAYQAGAMIRVSGPNIILSPPLILTSQDVQVILTALETAFGAM